jgi:hypothetical protein
MRRMLADTGVIESMFDIQRSPSCVMAYYCCMFECAPIIAIV